jgi:hypothetical protein
MRIISSLLFTTLVSVSSIGFAAEATAPASSTAAPTGTAAPASAPAANNPFASLIDAINAAKKQQANGGAAPANPFNQNSTTSPAPNPFLSQGATTAGNNPSAAPANPPATTAPASSN